MLVTEKKMMNVTVGSEFASVEPMLWTNSSNVIFTDLDINENNSTVATFVDTVPTQEIEFPEVTFELNWLDPLALYIKGLFVILAILMAMYMVGRKVVAHVRMRFGCDLSVNLRLGDLSRNGIDDVGGGDGRSTGREGRNVAMRNFV